MVLNGSPPTTQKNTEVSGEFSFLCREELAPLKAEGASLLNLADMLEQLAGNLNSSGTDERARALAGGLRAGLAACLDKEAAVLRGLGQPRVGALRNAMDRTRREYAALRGLAAPVVAGLRALGQNRFPTPVNRFVFATNVLCVFIRMHVQFKNETLYPLLAGSQPSGQARADTGRSPRNGATAMPSPAAVHSGARKTEDRSAHEWRQRKKSILGRQRKRVPPPDPRTADMLVRLFGGPVSRNKLQKNSGTE
ncbi:MAG: hypothetical protein GEU92_06175 [Alphaproteobacteria bacterium]|nr:hypothetical protein [Alphaproteobacteria bacterium]